MAPPHIARSEEERIRKEIQVYLYPAQHDANVQTPTQMRVQQLGYEAGYEEADPLRSAELHEALPVFRVYPSYYSFHAVMAPV